MNRTLINTGIVLATLLAVGLGGSVDLPAQTVLAAVAGLLLLLAPPQRPLPRVPLVLGVLLLLIALLAFLPAGDNLHALATGAPWRKYVLLDAHVALGGQPGPLAFPIAGTWTLQPWLTLQACTLLFVGLAWGLYLLALPWHRGDRVSTAELLVLGVALLALLAALAFILKFHVPGWTQTENRGWFPNRNQTADVLALCGITAYALIFDRLRKGRHTGYLLLGALVPLVVELVISYSRAGILLFFGGVLAWHLWPHPGQRRGKSIKWLALSAALGIILLAVFLIFGGQTLSRFLNPAPPGATTQDITDFRGAIQSDALRFSLQSPWLGTGLGNFEPLFSFSRVASINGNRAIHPESDWLWLASEMGWPAALLVLAGFIWWLRSALPLENKSGESMRRALIVAVVVFVVHGFVDVSAHRPGSLWVALLLAGMALPVRDEQPRTFVTPLFFRALGLALLAIAAWWGSSLLGWNVPPTTATLDRMKQELAGNLTPPAAIRAAGDALRIAPLDWDFYFQRGEAELSDRARFDAARRDFATADILNPYWIELPIAEGEAWLDASEPGVGLDAWTDGLERAGPLAPEMYREMVGLAPPHSIMRQGLAELAFANLGYLLTILPSATPEEAEALIEHLLQTDPHLDQLSARQRHDLFAGWWSQGDQARMMGIVQEHPELDRETWPYQARFAAKEYDFPHACAICSHWANPPAVPQIGPARSLDRPLLRFPRQSRQFLTDGLALFLAQIAGRTGTARHWPRSRRMRRKLPDDQQAASIFPTSRPSLQAAKGDWPAAWAAWQNFPPDRENPSRHSFRRSARRRSDRGHQAAFRADGRAGPHRSRS